MLKTIPAHDEAESALFMLSKPERAHRTPPITSCGTKEKRP